MERRIPERGFVPDEDTAIRIAEAVWLPLFGAHLDTKRPFRAYLDNDVWHVMGSLPRHMLGGVPHAEIARLTGEILRVWHDR